MKRNTVEWINTLGAFCGVRDVPTLTKDALEQKYGFRQADVMVLFGGSILCGGNLLAEAMKNQAAKKYVIVGGAGHTTEDLRQAMGREVPEIQTAGRPEAEIFQAYLEYRYGRKADLLERESTNCGNNITYLLKLLKSSRVPYQRIILTQDAAMQRRMDATLRKYAGEEMAIINYAAYQAKVVERDSKLAFDREIWGIVIAIIKTSQGGQSWPLERYLTLLMGEISRLSDTPEGYGPSGKGYIAHVEIPEEVETAFTQLKREYPGMVREANPLYASADPQRF